MRRPQRVRPDIDVIGSPPVTTKNGLDLFRVGHDRRPSVHLLEVNPTRSSATTEGSSRCLGLVRSAGSDNIGILLLCPQHQLLRRAKSTTLSVSAIA